MELTDAVMSDLSFVDVDSVAEEVEEWENEDDEIVVAVRREAVRGKRSGACCDKSRRETATLNS